MAFSIWLVHRKRVYLEEYLGILLVRLFHCLGICITHHFDRHQLHRRWFESANSLLRRMLGVTKGSIISRYLQLYNAFFLSAVMHHVGSLNNPYSPMAWAQVAFFLMQPVAITFEDLAIYLGEQAGLEKNRKFLLGGTYSGHDLIRTGKIQSSRFCMGMPCSQLHAPVCSCSCLRGWIRNCETSTRCPHPTNAANLWLGGKSMVDLAG